MVPLKRLIFLLIFLILFLLFFIGGPDYHSSRSYKSFWNLGHILFFLLFPLLISYYKRTSSNYLNQCIFIIAITIILGVIIELLQSGFQRMPDAGDLFRNIIGAMVYLFFLLPSRKTISKRILLMMQSGTVVLIGLQIFPVIIAFTDEYIARTQFPELSGFETPYEIQRWSGNADFITDKKIKQTGKASMRVFFNTSKYSGIGLRYFPKNWEGFSYFQFAIFNPSSEDISLTCRINDKKHTELGQRYEDRFNRSFSIPKGWNTITVSLKNIKHAPKNRQMNMHEIRNVLFFSSSLPYQRIINIDDVKLSP